VFAVSFMVLINIMTKLELYTKSKIHIDIDVWQKVVCVFLDALLFHQITNMILSPLREGRKKE